MHKKLLALALLAITSPGWISTPASASVWQAKFTSDTKMPAGLRAKNGGGAQANASAYKAGNPDAAWFPGIMSGAYTVLSCTYNNANAAVQNVLELPEIELPAEATHLVFTAQSVMPERPESVEVRVAESGSGEYLLVKSIDRVASAPTPYFADLSSFAGKSVNIQLVCTSATGYMLSISGIEVDTTDKTNIHVSLEPTLYAENEQPRGGVCRAKGTMLNLGKTIPAETVFAVVINGEGADGFYIENPILPGQYYEFDLPFQAPDNETTDYTFAYLDENGDFKTLAKSSVTRSVFARTHLMDEGTGTWCPNCPEGMFEIDKLQAKYGNQIEVVCTHIQDTDPMQNAGYWSHLGFYAAPYFMLNRNSNAKYGAPGKISAQYFNEETPADIKVTDFSIAPDDSQLTLQFTTTMGSRTVNNNDRFTVGYVLTSDFYQPAGNILWQQQNSVANQAYGRFYYLPGKIPQALSYYHHVGVTSEDAFAGIKGSLPEIIQPYSEYSCTVSVPKPELVNNFNDTKVVAYVLDNVLGKVLNATSLKLSEGLTTGLVSSEFGEGGNAPALAFIPSGSLLSVSAGDAAAWQLDVYSADGALSASYCGKGNTAVPVCLTPGIYFANLCCGGTTKTLKVLVR